MSNKKHQGKFVKEIIKNKGYTLTYVQEALKLSRNTLYIKLKKERLQPVLLYRIGEIINHNFATSFPEIERDKAYQKAKTKVESLEAKCHKQIAILQNKYYLTLESYSKLLRFLVRIVNENDFNSLKKEINVLIGKNKKKDPPSNEDATKK